MHIVPGGRQPGKVTVVGAGIGGLTAAFLAAKAGMNVELFEQQPHPGGLLAPVEFAGFFCDRGSHRVHPKSHPLLQELTAAVGWQIRPRQGRLVFGGKLLPYPPTPARFLQGLGLRASIQMAIGWLQRPSSLRRAVLWEKERADVAEDEGFESFVLSRVGKTAYERFYRPYAIKVWGGDPKELSRSVAKQRVSTSSPLPVLLGLAKQEYLYPASGMASLTSHLRNQAQNAGVQFHFATKYSLDSVSEDPLLFSGHLADIAPNSGLEHRGLYLLYLQVPADALDNVDTWYAPETDFWFGRVSQPAQFSQSFKREHTSVLCVEIPEGNWGSEQDFIGQITILCDQLLEAGILRRSISPSLAHQIFLPRIYPMYRRGWTERWRKALEQVCQRGPIYPFGRQGLFLHCNMDHSVQIAADLVKHITDGASSRHWAQHCRNYLSVRVRD